MGAAAVGSLLAGLGVAALTLRLNSHLHVQPAAALVVAAYFAVGSLAVGLAAGAVTAIGLGVAARFSSWAGVRAEWIEAARWAAGSLLSLAPLAYLLLLPDLGLAGSLLSDLLGARAAVRLGVAALVAAVLAVVGLAARAVWCRLPARPRRWLPRLAAGAFLAVVGSLVAWIVLGGPQPEPAASAAFDAALNAVPAVATFDPPEGPPPPRVVLLCIDGADPDDVVLPLVARGELPTFARLLEEGTRGELATIEPTLSAVVWTTIATGRSPAEHGIRGFVNFRLPGLGPSIEQFPLHTGLNFHLFPLLEKLPGVPPIQVPYTSNMRRAPALWEMVGRAYPVGVYQWLITWPAEPVEGFMVAGGLGWVQFAGAFRAEVGDELGRRASEPPGLAREVAAARRAAARRLGADDFAPYFGADTPAGGAAPGSAGPRRRAVAGSLSDPAAELLPRWIRRFDARFTAASFYPVDAFHHLFARRSGPLGGAVAAAYRHTDARLGELLAALEAGAEPVNLIVVSDHGFDFARHHHTWAPPGLLLNRGPAFAPGREVEGLSVYDVAPLVLHLLGLPLADDLPGVATGAYLEALDPAWLAAHPQAALGRVPSYGPRAADHAPVAGPRDDELRDALRSLGYIR